MKNILIAFLLAAGWAGCVDKEIIIPQPEYTTRVSIQCALEVGKKPKLFLYRTIPYFDVATLREVFIDSATVKLSNSMETDSLTKDSTYNYLKCEYEYFYSGQVPVKQDEMYFLEIINGDAQYSATTKTNLSAVSIDSVGYTRAFTDIYGVHEGVIPYFHDIQGQTNFYRYQMTRPVDTTMQYREGKIYSPCIGSKTITVIELGRSVYGDDNLNGDQINMVIEPAYSHQKDLVGYVQIQTIDKASFDFYDQLDRQKLGQSNPFVEPVYLKDGQFGHDAVGFFGSIIKSDSVRFVFPE